MQTPADIIIDSLGGTTAVANLVQAPVSTVHSWRKIGIPPSRLAHLKLASHVAGKQVNWAALEAETVEASADVA